jgi:hypothetical protein
MERCGRRRGKTLSYVGDAVPRPSIRFFLEYWQGLRSERTLPRQDEISPKDFRLYLPGVFVVEGGRPEDLRVRLAGSMYQELYGVDITGLLVSELIPFSERSDLLDDFTRCLKDARPVLHEGRVTWRGRNKQLRYQRVLLPYGAGNRVCRILGFAEFDQT